MATTAATDTSAKIENPYRIIQITDPHLGASRDQSVLGINNYQSLELVVELVKQQQGRNFDRIVSTGDISSEGSEQSYRDFLQLMEPFGRPISWLPGNHDCPDTMAGIQDVPLLDPQRVVEMGAWQMLMLDSKISGAVGGNLDQQELELLEVTLKVTDNKHTLFCLHHQPVDVGCGWMDPQKIRNADRFFEIIEQYPGTKLVLWGHIHQQFEDTRNNIQLLATPSTCHQFEPLQQQFKIGHQLPGYRWLDLYPDGRIVTGVSRIKSTPFEIDYLSEGY
ncbi:MAG: 3',5'-cyclic-AMP phosphodiesterase [Pseudomonadales bacterium]|nr:3',5'-cyclic-AMP phosphodiesterase [Pseudomonadales bacterium]